MSGEQPDNAADGTEKDHPSPLEDLIVEEKSEGTREDMAEALEDLVGVTREEYVITLKDGIEALTWQQQVVAFVLASYARDLLEHGHVTGSTGRVEADDVGAALGVHPADVADAAAGHSHLRWYEQTREVELPHERVRHAARSLTHAKGTIDLDDGTATEGSYTLSTQSDTDTTVTGADQDDVETAITSAEDDGEADGGGEGGG